MPNCRKCNIDYDMSFFHKSSKYKNGFDTLCKKCKSLINKKYREKNKQKISIKRKEKYLSKKAKNPNLYKKEAMKDPIRWRAKLLKQGMLQRSKKNNIYLDQDFFTSDKIHSLIKDIDKCPCCFCDVSFLSNFDGSKNDKVLSVDRLDNNKGYIKDNVCFICWRCNNIKRNANIEDLAKLISWIEERLKAI